MLLSFTASNYKSFREPFVFSMQPAPKQKGLDYSLFTENAGKKKLRGLCSSVIYGPNASGKTNIIGAVDTFKAILLRGNIRNSDDSQGHRHSNLAAQRLELIPNSELAAAEPVEFGIRFLTEGKVFDYHLAVFLGKFLESQARRYVVSETLTIDGETVFSREGQKVVFHEPSKQLAPLFVGTDSAEEKVLRQRLALSGLNPMELFLMNGFKTMFSPRLVEQMTLWLTDKLGVIFHADSVQFALAPDDQFLDYFNEIIQPAVENFGVDSHDVIFARQGANAQRATLCSRVGGQVVPADVYESYGTIRFVNLFPLILTALKQGVTLFIDEFDASIHPMALMNIVNCFHNDEINVRHAQLIFNTHNPIFLNSDLHRRDEIKFVEQDEAGGGSRLYSLADFGTSGANGVRKGEDYLKNYFVNRYGAIRDVDFSALFLKEMSRTSTESDDKSV